MTTLFSHPRQPRRDLAAAVPAAPIRPTPRPASRAATHQAAARRETAHLSGALQRPGFASSFAPPDDLVPSFIPPTTAPPTAELELRQPAATWDAIASMSRQIRRSEATAVPSSIATLGRATRIGIRTFDLVSATALIVLTLPLMLLIGLVVGLTSRGPVLYLSWRIGRGGDIFGCLKFRTMVRDADAQLPHILAANPRLADEYRTSHSLRLDSRVTRVGRILRRTHLDELPQLFNVVTGRMSLVGPRPIVPKEMELCGPALAELLVVKPGITGAWQVSKRLGGYPGRIETDLRYVGRRTLLGDCWICVRTVLLVIGVGRRSNR